MEIEVDRVPELLVKTRCPEVIPLLELAFDKCRDYLEKERMDITNLAVIIPVPVGGKKMISSPTNSRFIKM